MIDPNPNLHRRMMGPSQALISRASDHMKKCPRIGQQKKRAVDIYSGMLTLRISYIPANHMIITARYTFHLCNLNLVLPL